MSKFKVGDRVKVKSWNRLKEIGDPLDLGLIKDIKKSSGKVFKIEDKGADGSVILNEGFFYDPSWLKKKETKKKSKKKWFTPEEKMPKEGDSFLIIFKNGMTVLSSNEVVVMHSKEVYKWRYAPKFPKLPKND